MRISDIVNQIMGRLQSAGYNVRLGSESNDIEKGLMSPKNSLIMSPAQVSVTDVLSSDFSLLKAQLTMQILVFFGTDEDVENVDNVVSVLNGFQLTSGEPVRFSGMEKYGGTGTYEIYSMYFDVDFAYRTV